MRGRLCRRSRSLCLCGGREVFVCWERFSGFRDLIQSVIDLCDSRDRRRRRVSRLDDWHSLAWQVGPFCVVAAFAGFCFAFGRVVDRLGVVCCLVCVVPNVDAVVFGVCYVGVAGGVDRNAVWSVELSFAGAVRSEGCEELAACG